MSESKHLTRVPRTFQQIVEFSGDRLKGKGVRLIKNLVQSYIKQNPVQITDEIDSDSLTKLYNLSVRLHFTKVVPRSVETSVLNELNRPDKFGNKEMKTLGVIDQKTGIGVQYAKFTGDNSIYCLPLNETDPIFQVNLYISDISAFFLGDEFDEDSFLQSATVRQDKDGMRWLEEAPAHIRKANQN